jgi:hypothetical protein
MKTAISIDNGIYWNAEDAAVQLGLTRSKLYTLAVEEYLQNHHPDAVTGQLNRYYNSRKAVLDDDIKQITYELFSREDW